MYDTTFCLIVVQKLALYVFNLISSLKLSQPRLPNCNAFLVTNQRNYSFAIHTHVHAL